MIEIKTIEGIITVNLDTITLDDVSEIISKMSVEVDVSDGALTVLYSGKINGYGTANIVTQMDNVRIIDNTEIAKFLSDNASDSVFNQLLNSAIKNDIINKNFDISRVEKGIYDPDDVDALLEIINKSEPLTSKEINDAITIINKAYKFEPTQGAWAIASEAFVKATPANSEIICITAEADLSRTWAAVEIPTALDNLPDEHIFCGYTVAELKTIRDTEGIEAVQNLLKQQSEVITSDITMFYDSNGKVIGIDTSILTGGTAVDAPSGTAVTATVGEVRAYLIDVCPDYSNLSSTNKNQVIQIVFEAHNQNFSEIQKILANDTTGYMKNVSISYDADGKLTGIELTDFSGKTIDMGNNSAVFDISWDGTTKARLESNASSDVWWKNKAVDIVQDSSISTINGVPAEQFRNSYNNFSTSDSNFKDKLVKAIDDIDSNNVDENALLKNLQNKKTSFFDELSKGVNAKNGGRVGAIVGMVGALGDGADIVDAAVTFATAYKQFEAGDVEGSSDTLGSWGMSTLGAIAAGAGAGCLIAGASGPVGWVVLAAASIVGALVGESFWDMFLDPLSKDYDSAGNARVPVDPLIIDLGLTGINLVATENGVHFDLDNNGFAEKTTWTDGEDGFLVLDRNSDGVINNGSELFGDRVTISKKIVA